ncbi:hypothetical protein J3459_014023 [Metarhizium acridum]|nr:hypothetical protein J3459_014023 [Metarhizium acridum]
MVSVAGLSGRTCSTTQTIILLATYLVFQLSNISFNSLYPIFASAPAPAGRNLSPKKIGFSLSAAGLATIAFQAFLFPPIKSKIGTWARTDTPCSASASA